jgi:predicted O-methyltransferase YrrM
MNESLNEKLIELEQTYEQYWNIPRESGNYLNLIIKAAGYKNILEIGTSNGYSGIWLAEGVRANSGHVTSIEYYQERIDLAKANFEECGLSDFITVLQGKALDIIETLDEEYDLIFIDANKAEYVKYFNKLHPKLKQNGLFVADNVTSHKDKIKDFLGLIDQHPEYQVSYLPFRGGLLIGLKK